MSRIQLFSFRSFITLFTGARSTRWPGPSRSAIHFLFFCLLIAIAQFAVNLALGINLLRIGNTVLCQLADEPIGFADNVVPLPVTFAKYDEAALQDWDFMSMHQNRKKTEIVLSSFCTPLLIIAIIVVQIVMHCRSISNRTGMLFAACLISLFIVANIQDTWLDIDAKKLHDEYSWCWQPDEEMRRLWAKRLTRLRLLLAGEVLGGIGGLGITFYFVLAITAATANRLDSERQSTRLQTLRTNSNTIYNANSRGGAVPSPHLSVPSSTPFSSAPAPPAVEFGLTLLSTAAKSEECITPAERRKREPVEANRQVYENPFADPEDSFGNTERLFGNAGPADVVRPSVAAARNCEGKCRNDSAC